MNLTACVLVGIGTVLVLYATIKPPPERRSYLDMQAIMAERSKYLPDIKKGLADYLERAESLASASDLYDPDVYRCELGTHDKTWGWVNRLITITEKRDKNALWQRIYNNFLIDNTVSSRIKQDDAIGEGSIRHIKMNRRLVVGF